MRIKVALASSIAALVLVGASVTLAAAIAGTDGDDTLIGTSSADLIRGLGGNDRIGGRAGPDILLAGAGNDRARGGNGGDVIWGNAGADQLYGGHGDDVVRGRGGDDEIGGGRGDDQLFGGFGADDEHGGYGRDKLHAVARDKQLDKLNCGPGRDVAVIRAGEPTAVRNCEKVEVVPDDPSSMEEPGESPSDD
jgi:Ca2+-binding RTX toxin-like protein